MVVKVPLRGGILFGRGYFTWEGALFGRRGYIHHSREIFSPFWGFWLLLIGRGNTESGTVKQFSNGHLPQPPKSPRPHLNPPLRHDHNYFFPHLFCTNPNHTFFLETRFFQKFTSLICFTYSLIFTSLASNFFRRFFSLLNFCVFFYF